MPMATEILTVTTIATGFLSLTGSSLLICTILRSKKKLTVPYRRIIFGTSVYDVLQSVGLTSSIFLSPKDMVPPKPMALGNTTTCDIQGFITTVGAMGVPFYLCSLSIYYFCIIRMNMRNDAFRRLEPYLHGIPIIYSLFCGIYALTMDYYNNAGSVCYVAPAPITCEILTDVECTRGEGATKFRTYFLTYPSMIIFVIVCSIMAIITWSVKAQERRQRRYLFPRPYQPPSLPEASVQDDSNCSLSTNNRCCYSFGTRITNALFCCPSSSSTNNDNNSPPKDAHSQSHTSLTVSNTRRSSVSSTAISNNRPSSSSSSTRSRRARDRTGEIMKQALLYVGSYVLSYGFVWAMSIYSLATKMPAPIALRFLSAIFFPLQGFVNIFIYCRPHIVSLRRDFPDDYSWFQAFKRVLKSGGDDPLTSQERRLSSMRRAASARRQSSMTNIIEGDPSDTEPNDSIARMIMKAEMCEKKVSSLTSISVFDIENQSEESFIPGMQQQTIDSKKPEPFEYGMGERICIPSGDGKEDNINIILDLSSHGESLPFASSELGSSSHHETKAKATDRSQSLKYSTLKDIVCNDTLTTEGRNLEEPSVFDRVSGTAGASNNSYDDDDDDVGDGNGKDTREISEDDSSVDSIPKYLKNFILEAEQLLDETTGEFLTTTTTTTTITTCNEDKNTAQLGNDEDLEDVDPVIDTAAMGRTPVRSSNKEAAADTNTTDNTTLQDGPMDVDDDDDNNNDEAN